MGRSWGRLEWDVYDERTERWLTAATRHGSLHAEARSACEGAPKEGFVDVGYI